MSNAALVFTTIVVIVIMATSRQGEQALCMLDTLSVIAPCTTSSATSGGQGVKLVPSEFPAEGKNPTLGAGPSAHK